MKLRIRNWSKFQHYKFRKPPWIKLYREILDDPDWHTLSGESAKGLIMLWLIASEEDGYLPDSKTLAFRLRISENRVIGLLSDCCNWFEQGASALLASCKQDATPETETETEVEKRKPFPIKTVMGSSEFQIFWEQYPRKVDKKEAIKAWVKGVCDGSIGEILASLESWKKTEQWCDPEHIPYPSTWINKQRWQETPTNGQKLSVAEQKARKTSEAIARVKQRLDNEMATEVKPAFRN